MHVSRPRSFGRAQVQKKELEAQLAQARYEQAAAQMAQVQQRAELLQVRRSRSGRAGGHACAWDVVCKCSSD
jgi:hypothetical protein